MFRRPMRTQPDANPARYEHMVGREDAPATGISMLTRLSIRDIVLIDRLDIDFAAGLSVLTGETGAGKSILLDSFALALGGRGDAGLVRQGVEQGQVTAVFDVPKGHPASAILSDNGLDGAGSEDS